MLCTPEALAVTSPQWPVLPMTGTGPVSAGQARHVTGRASKCAAVRRRDCRRTYRAHCEVGPARGANEKTNRHRQDRRRRCATASQHEDTVSSVPECAALASSEVRRHQAQARVSYRYGPNERGTSARARGRQEGPELCREGSLQPRTQSRIDESSRVSGRCWSGQIDGSKVRVCLNRAGCPSGRGVGTWRVAPACTRVDVRNPPWAIHRGRNPHKARASDAPAKYRCPPDRAFHEIGQALAHIWRRGGRVTVVELAGQGGCRMPKRRSGTSTRGVYTLMGLAGAASTWPGQPNGLAVRAARPAITAARSRGAAANA